jgi:hypothetical protein
VAHGPARFGYPRFSEAMVNVRDALARARARRLIAARTHDRLLALAGAQFYRDRTWDTVLAAGRAAKLPARQLRQLAAWIERLKPDRKAADAALLLRGWPAPAGAPAHPRAFGPHLVLASADRAGALGDSAGGVSA